MSFERIILWHVAAFCFYISQYLCNAATVCPQAIVDLSHEFNNETIYWIGATPFSMDVKFNGSIEGPDRYWFQVEDITANTHVGTHLDAPCHFAQGFWCVSDIPIDRLVVQGAVVDISSYVNDDPDVHLTPDHLMEWEEMHGRIPNNSLLLIVTGWARFWPDRQTYSGTTGTNTSLLKFPTITAEAAQWVVDNRNIFGLGIDTMSVDIPGRNKPEVHIIMGERNIYNVENVNDQARLLPPTGATIYVMPMKLKDASGAPCRIFATTSGQNKNIGAGFAYIIFLVVLICSFYTVHNNYP